MKLEIRADSVLIDGYVNVVERQSKILRDRAGSFVETIKAGAFRRSIERAKMSGYDIKVLLNHQYDRQLAAASAPKTTLAEDNVGLRCICEIMDAEVVKKAKSGQLVGWSFGFIPIVQKRERLDTEDFDRREISELDLREVSILDSAKTPAYIGTSLELRGDDVVELRMVDDAIEIVEATPKTTDLYRYKNRLLLTKI